MIHVDQHDIQLGAVAPGLLLVQGEIVSDAVAQGQPGQRIVSYRAGQDQSLEIGQQADQLGLRLLESLKVGIAPRLPAHDMGANGSNGVMHGPVGRFHAPCGRRIQRLEMALVCHEPDAETAKGMRQRVEHILVGRRA